MQIGFKKPAVWGGLLRIGQASVLMMSVVDSARNGEGEAGEEGEEGAAYVPVWTLPAIATAAAKCIGAMVVRS